MLNNIFEKNSKINVGEGILVPVQKPWPKPKGPVKNLRPITLLNIIRKILSRMTTKRIEPKINQYLSESQSAYRRGRSTTDIVWAYRWILAKAQEYKIKIYVIGIDMSSAFDTINRKQLLDSLDNILEEDEVRVIKELLSDTTLEVKVEGASITAFNSNIGSPQGDSASGPLFEIYFENALRVVRSVIQSFRQKNKVKRVSALPEEMIYADDCDFLTTSFMEKQYINENTDKILKEYNLLVNTDKTENTILERYPGKKGSEKEQWRKVRKLGSLLGDKEDIKNRKQIASANMKKLKDLWNRKKVSMSRKLKLYNTLVKSILSYNSGTWGLTTKDEDSLDSFHRQQLRQVMNIKYPSTISSKKVYKVTKTKPISVEITRARWKLFGHILRMNKETPARKAMKYYFEKESMNKFRGRKRSTIVTTINRDIKTTKKKNPRFDLPVMKTELDLHNIRVKAKNRRLWRKRVELVTTTAYSERLKKL